MDNGTKTEIILIKKGIAWWTDKNVKFRNPTGDYNLSYIFTGNQTSMNNLNVFIIP